MDLLDSLTAGDRSGLFVRFFKEDGRLFSCSGPVHIVIMKKKSGVAAMCKKDVDLFLFMGQSNMAGRGIVNDLHPEGAPALIAGAGYEYRAVSSPGRLYPIAEPFGRLENRAGGIDDGDMKTGSMVTAFVNAYYEAAGVPVVGVSASKGGSRIDFWQPGGSFLTDAIDRMRDACRFLDANDYRIRHRLMLWCQGESDGDAAKPGSQYQREFTCMLDAMLHEGIERCFLIRIGQYNGTGSQDYRGIMAAQDAIAETNRHDKWQGFYANECLADVKQSAWVLAGYMSYVRNLGEGPDYHEWQRELTYSEENRRVMLILMTENHLPDEEIYRLMKRTRSGQS